MKKVLNSLRARMEMFLWVLGARGQVFLRQIFHPAFVPISESTLLAGPGFGGFNGGVRNPGAVDFQGGTLLLAKGEECHWTRSIDHDWGTYMKGSPLLIHLAEDLQVQRSDRIENLAGFPEKGMVGIEDFRLFAFREKIYAGHVMTVTANGKAFSRDNYELRNRQVLSAVDLREKKMVCLGVPHLDFATNPISEKNWVYFSNGPELYMLYSFSPYIVLKTTGETVMDFKTVIQRELRFDTRRPGLLRGRFIGLSTNPVDYDGEHLLMLVHQSIREDRSPYYRVYFHWAVLINKKTLLPVKISSRPLFAGGKCRGKLPGVIFTSSLLRRRDDFVFFNGEGDDHLSCVKLSKERIAKIFIDFPRLAG